MTLSPDRTLETTQGASVAIVTREARERIEVRDARSRLVFEFDPGTGKATLTLPEGDLSVRAPNGDIELAAGKVLKLSAQSLEIDSERADLSLGELVVSGVNAVAQWGSAKLTTERIETVTGRLFERARSVFRRVEDLHQIKAGRTRTIVDGGHVVRSGHISIEAREETKIDGSQILLG